MKDKRLDKLSLIEFRERVREKIQRTIAESPGIKEDLLMSSEDLPNSSEETLWGTEEIYNLSLKIFETPEKIPRSLSWVPRIPKETPRIPEETPRIPEETSRITVFSFKFTLPNVSRMLTTITGYLFIALPEEYQAHFFDQRNAMLEAGESWHIIRCKLSWLLFVALVWTPIISKLQRLIPPTRISS